MSHAYADVCRTHADICLPVEVEAEAASDSVPRSELELLRLVRVVKVEVSVVRM